MSAVVETPTFSEVVIGQIRAEMARAKFTQGQLAARMGKQQQWLQRRLSGETKIDLDDLSALAGAFKMSPEALLERARRDSNSQPSDPKSDRSRLQLVHGSSAEPTLEIVPSPPRRLALVTHSG
jgi:transcriptional regulator with XRE-family HTH domain